MGLVWGARLGVTISMLLLTIQAEGPQHFGGLSMIWLHSVCKQVNPDELT